VSLGAVADLKAGPLLTTDPVSGEAAYLVKTSAGVTMLSAVCTHLGCTVEWSAAQRRFDCPCHGGAYRIDGSVLSGPPPRPLREIAVRVTDGQVFRQPWHEETTANIRQREGDTVHRTRIGSLVIDCHDLPAGLAFWTAALGVSETRGDPDSEAYVSLGHVAGGLRLLLQRVPEQKTCKSRLHLDIETDDTSREIARLTALGAAVVDQTPDGDAVLIDPNGNEFCVIPPETPGFPDGTIAWADD
jgi:nitrite reductase/ring-hydroxylating ferredoxin subunit/predicted enzyme related to lactoylglutathione lyase